MSLVDLTNATNGTLSTSIGREGIAVAVSFAAEVRNGSGSWLPADTSHGSGLQRVHTGTHVLGHATFTWTFHVNHGGANDSAVKFDLGVSPWPWVSSGDELGVEVDSTAAVGCALGFGGNASDLHETGGPSSTTVAELQFGPSAIASSGGNGALQASAQGEVFSVGSVNNYAAILLTFSGQAGGYPNLSYDPWVVFSPSRVVPVPSTLLTWQSGVALGIVAAGTLALAVIALRARRGSAEDDPASAFENESATARRATEGHASRGQKAGASPRVLRRRGE